MPIKVDNLDNLFWDNGSWRLPNTFPKLATGKWLDKNPVMTTAVTGWVILEGEWNYAEFNDELFFLKKDSLVSTKKKKYRYILVKDHFCNILKNKGNVFVQGTLINTSLEKITGNDFNFTNTVINNFGKKLLFPLKEQHFDWKRHLIPVLPTKVFSKRLTVDNEVFSTIIKRLQSVADLNPNYNPADPANDALTIFSRIPKRRVLVNDWRNEIVQKIKELLADLENEDVILSKVSPSTTFSNTDLANRWCITYKSNSIGEAQEREEFKQVVQLDLSQLKDIVAIEITNPHNPTNFIPINQKKFVYDETAVPDSEMAATDIAVLEKRVTVPFTSKYSTRAVYHTGDSYKSIYWEGHNQVAKAQKIFIKNNNPLVLKSEHKDPRVTSVRTTEEFRSVYLHYCENFNFFFKFSPPEKLKTEYPRNKDKAYLVKDKSTAKDTVVTWSSLYYLDWSNVDQRYYEFWKALKDAKELLTFGWQIGQFSKLISVEQKNKFDHYYPYLVKTGFKSLRRIKGFKDKVQQLIQNKEFFEEQETSPTYNPEAIYTLDFFETLPIRFIENTKELDFCIGEKLLFFTYGPLAYLYFQPAYYQYDYGAYYTPDILPSLQKNLNESWRGSNWLYLYDFCNRNIFWKEWIRKAYENWKEYKFKTKPPHFFVNDAKPYLDFEKNHIMKNTNEFFVTEEVEFETATKRGDYFWTDLDYFLVSRNQPPFSRLDTSFITEEWNRQPLEDKEIIVFSDVGQGKLVIGKVKKIPQQVTLPEGQFIATDHIQSESNKNTLDYNAYHLVNASKRALGFTSFNSLIDELKANAHIYYQDWFAFSLADIDRPYLLDLVGTDFYAYLDSKKKIHLIFKKNEHVTDAGELIYSIDITDSKEDFLPVQIINQKCMLSLYGMKLDLPVKLYEKKAPLTILVDTAKKVDGLMDSARVEVRHALGTSYFRLDIPKKIPRKTADNYDPFQAEALQSAIKRSYENYKLQKEAQDIQFQQLDNSFDDQKWAVAHQRKDKFWRTAFQAIGEITTFASGIGAIGNLSTFFKNAVNTAGGISGKDFIQEQETTPVTIEPADTITPAGLTRRLNLPALTTSATVTSSKFNRGAIDTGFQDDYRSGYVRIGNYRVRLGKNISTGKLLGNATGMGISSIGGLVADYMLSNEKFNRQEEQLARDIKLTSQKKLLESYELDLSFDNQRSDNAFLMRKIFSFQNFNASSSYERNEQLDKQELPELKIPVYLELWIPSKEQIPYLQSFHEKYGVDCRITHQTLYISDGMPLGIFKFEEPTIINLNDFMDNELMRMRFEQGIKIELWEEQEVRPELIPVDPRVLALQKQLGVLQLEERTLKEEIKEKEVQIDQLQDDLRQVKGKRDELEVEVTGKKEELKNLGNSLRQIESDLTKQKQLFSDSQKEVVRLNTEIAGAGTRYHDLSESYRAKEKELEESEKVKKLYLDEKNKLAQEKSTLETDLKDTKARETVLIQEKSKSNSKIESLEKEKTQLEEKVKECAKTEEQVSQLEEKLQKKEDEVNAQKLQIDSLLVKEQELNKLKEEIKQLVQGCGTLEEVKQSYAETQKTFKQLARENRELHKELPKLVELQNKVKEQENTIKALREIEKFDVKNLPNKYALSAANNLIRAYVDYAEMKTYLFSSNEKSVRMPKLYEWDSKLKIFTLLNNAEYLGDIEAKKLWAYKNDGSSFSSATEFDMGYFWKFKYQRVRGNKFKKIWDGGIRITNPRNNLAYTDSYDDSYDKAIYVGETKLICSPYLDFVPKLATFYSALESIPVPPEPHEIELERKIYFHPDKGWANDGNKVQNFKDLDLSKVITLVTYEDYLNFFGWKWDPVEKKAVPK